VSNDYKVWTCKIVVPADTKLPNGFDAPPRWAAMQAVEATGIPVLSCFSGWGGKLSDSEREIVDADLRRLLTNQ